MNTTLTLTEGPQNDKLIDLYSGFHTKLKVLYCLMFRHETDAQSCDKSEWNALIEAPSVRWTSLSACLLLRVCAPTVRLMTVLPQLTQLTVFVLVIIFCFLSRSPHQQPRRVTAHLSGSVLLTATDLLLPLRLHPCVSLFAAWPLGACVRACVWKWFKIVGKAEKCERILFKDTFL